MNGSAAVIAKIIKNDMASAAEAETGALFVNVQIVARTAAQYRWVPVVVPVGSLGSTAILFSTDQLSSCDCLSCTIYFLLLRRFALGYKGQRAMVKMMC